MPLAESQTGEYKSEQAISGLIDLLWVEKVGRGFVVEGAVRSFLGSEARERGSAVILGMTITPTISTIRTRSRGKRLLRTCSGLFI